MSRHNDSYSALDRRVASGLKVVASGSEALEWTPAQLLERHCIAAIKCICGYKGYLNYRAMKADRAFGSYSFKCSACGSKATALEVLDPWEANSSGHGGA